MLAGPLSPLSPFAGRGPRRLRSPVGDRERRGGPGGQRNDHRHHRAREAEVVEMLIGNWLERAHREKAHVLSVRIERRTPVLELGLADLVDLAALPVLEENV